VFTVLELLSRLQRADAAAGRTRQLLVPVRPGCRGVEAAAAATGVTPPPSAFGLKCGPFVVVQLFSRFGSSAGTTVEQLMQMGVFTLQFYKDCVWHVVTVDSFLPCKVRPLFCLWQRHWWQRCDVEQDASLVFASSGDSNVFWPGILEKGYAKLHGSYASLQGGSVADALVDLTGRGRLLCSVALLPLMVCVQAVWL
jgi:hypothetical protein